MAAKGSLCGSCQALKLAAGWRGWQCAAWMKWGDQLLGECGAAFRCVRTEGKRDSHLPVIGLTQNVPMAVQPVHLYLSDASLLRAPCHYHNVHSSASLSCVHSVVPAAGAAAATAAVSN
jgi:hypothetical protein